MVDERANTWYMVLVYGLDQRGRRGVSYLDRSIEDVINKGWLMRGLIHGIWYSYMV